MIQRYRWSISQPGNGMIEDDEIQEGWYRSPDVDAVLAEKDGRIKELKKMIGGFEDIVLDELHKKIASLERAVKEKDKQIRINLHEIDLLSEQIAALRTEGNTIGELVTENAMLKAERDALLLHPSEPGSPWQGVNKEVKLWEARALKAEVQLAALKAENYQMLNCIEANNLIPCLPTKKED